MTVVFLDFEASSLNQGSYPIETGWTNAGGEPESYLIAPAAEWTDWSYASQAVHGLTQDDLTLRGRPVSEVAARALEALAGPGVVVASDQPRWEQLWLDRLMVAAGISDHGIVVQDADGIYILEARRLLDLAAGDDHQTRSALRDEASDIIGDCQVLERERHRVRHRAGPDAGGMAWVLMEIRRRVDVRLGRS